MRPFVRGAIYIAIALCILVAGWIGYRVYDVYTGLQGMVNVKAPYVAGETKVIIPPIDSNHRINILVLGSDNDKKKEEAHPDTQSMIVVTINPRDKRVDMLSIPRDFWVNIPGHGMGKIDLAYHYGGVSLARYTVEKLFHIAIRNYAWVGLDGFVKVIDTFGGVTLDVNHPILDDYYPNDMNAADPYGYTRVFIPAGWQYMHGPQALQYVRSRHGDRIGDFGRSARQQQVLQQLRQHVNTLDILRNLPSLVDDLRGRVQTDLGPTELYQLAQLSRNIPQANIHQLVLSVPQYSSYGQASNPAFGLQDVVFPNWKKIRPVTSALFAPLPPLRATRPNRVVPRPKSTERAVPGATTISEPTPIPALTATPHPSPTAPPPATSRLPGTLLYAKDGNIHALSPSLTDASLTSDGGASQRYSMFSVSPDRHWLAYIRFTDIASDLWVRSLRSGKSYKVTSGSLSQDIHDNLWAAWPSWTSDGKALLLSWDAQKRRIPESEARPVDLAIWRMSSHGSQRVQLTSPATGAGGDTEVAVRPHSGQYVYVHWDYNPQNNQPFSRLILADPAQHGGVYPLTPQGGRTLDPAWNPSGTHMAFVRMLPTGAEQVVEAPVFHTSRGPALGPRRVVDWGRVAQPSFSPDGRWISYVKADGTGFAIYLERTSGGPAYRIDAAGSGIDATTRPVWTK